jgi:hypothetical protein
VNRPEESARLCLEDSSWFERSLGKIAHIVSQFKIF